MSLFRTLARTTALTCALALPLAPLGAQDAPPEQPVTLWDQFSLENILTLVVQSFMPTLRLLADVRYDQIDVDPVRNRLSLVGVDIRPYLPYVTGDACAITADSIVLSGQPVDRQQGYGFHLSLDGAVVDFDCFPQDARPMIGLAGLENLRLDRATLLVNYDFSSGGAKLSFGADLDQLVAITGSADLDYISYRMDLESEEVMPAVHVNAVQLSVEDRGAYETGKRMAPPGMLEPDAAAQLVQGGLTQLFAEMNGFEARELSSEQEAFVTQASALARAYVLEPGLVVVETAAPVTPVRLGEGDLEDPKAIFSKLAPMIGTAPRAVVTGVSAADLKQAIDGLLPKERNLEVGRALITGIGAPRNVTLGLRLLDPLAKEGNAEASGLMASAMADSAPETAYRLALHAASHGQAGSLSLLSDLEQGLNLGKMLDLQDAMLGGGGPVASDYASLGDIRRAARGHLMGTARIRSYRAAYYWASVGAAAGDAASVAMRDEIDTIMRLRGSEAAWGEVITSLENGVLRDWVGRDLPDALQQ